VIEYPYNSPIILTDTIYTAYGGLTGTSLPAQRQAAYLIAEKQMTSHLNTFLLPTTVTGTYSVDMLGYPLELGYGHVRSVNSILFYSDANSCYSCDLLETDGCSVMYNEDYGYIYVRQLEGAISSCGCIVDFPYLVKASFTSGLVSGSAYQADILLALTMAANQVLMEIIDPGALEGGKGDPGVQSWSSMSHSENRYALGQNAFGKTPVAQYIAQLVESYSGSKKALRFH